MSSDSSDSSSTESDDDVDQQDYGSSFLGAKLDFSTSAAHAGLDDSSCLEPGGSEIGGINAIATRLQDNVTLQQSTPVFGGSNRQSGELLIVCLLEQLCALHQQNPLRSQQLFRTLCGHLARIGVRFVLDVVL